MAALLRNWLKTHARIDDPVPSFERQFSNGYLFGRVLAQFGRQEDWPNRFRENDSTKAKVLNFKRLERSIVGRGSAGHLVSKTVRSSTG